MTVVNTAVFIVSFFIYTAIAAFSLFSTAKALLLFTKFVSCQTNGTTVHEMQNGSSDIITDFEREARLSFGNHHLLSEEWDRLLRMLAVDFLLLALFILQHSVMACRRWKSCMHWLGLGVVERALYVISTSFVLQAVIENWQYTNSSMLWFVDTDNRPWLWLFFTVLHALGWTLILGSTLLMDVCELIGIKQVYYFTLGLDSPIAMKSSGLQRLYVDMRHPGAVSLTLMLVIHPHMTASRAMLTIIMMLYCMVRFDLDKEDHSYLQQKLASKEDELNALIAKSYQHEEMSVRHVWKESFQSST